MSEYIKVQETILNELEKTLNGINQEEVNLLLNEIVNAEKVFFVGVGRVLLSLKSIAKRFAHLGINSVVVGQITEPAITSKDLLIVGSGSGESIYPLKIAEKAQQYNAKIAHIGANSNGSMKKYTNFFIEIPTGTKYHETKKVDSVQPMTSLFEQSVLLLGDILSLMLIRNKNIDISSLWEYHANLE